MSSVKSPQEKKRLAYDRDHVTPAKYPHAFRKKWPRKKARAERSARRKIRQTLKASGDHEEVANVRRKKVRKWDSITVRESVQSKQQKRQEMVGAHKARQARRAEDAARPVHVVLEWLVRRGLSTPAGLAAFRAAQSGNLDGLVLARAFVKRKAAAFLESVWNDWWQSHGFMVTISATYREEALAGLEARWRLFRPGGAYRSRKRTRVITARPMTRSERKSYETTQDEP